jgi:hypothetical protein
MGAEVLMRVILDTNVLLSALISPYGTPDAIFAPGGRRACSSISDSGY